MRLRLRTARALFETTEMGLGKRPVVQTKHPGNHSIQLGRNLHCPDAAAKAHAGALPVLEIHVERLVELGDGPRELHTAAPGVGINDAKTLLSRKCLDSRHVSRVRSVSGLELRVSQIGSSRRELTKLQVRRRQRALTAHPYGDFQLLVRVRRSNTFRTPQRILLTAGDRD